MPKIKTCPHCSEVLVCKACERRVTPDFRRTRARLTDLVDEKLITELRTQAREKGVSINVLLAQRLQKEEKDAKPKTSKSNRRCAVEN